ncbi:MAG: Sensor phosphatase [Actinotalea sp.]|nr:Sensor phosphatase [Actinotalea sp.]
MTTSPTELPAHDTVHVREVLTLPAEPASAGRARRLLRDVLTAADRLDCLDAAELACTELVTNAVLHAHTPVELMIEVSDEVRVQVRDFSQALPAERRYDMHATTGRGLALIAALSDQHGITDAGPAGKTVWFTVGGPGPRPAEEPCLSEWAEGEWDLEGIEAAAPREQTVTVRLVDLPPTLWLAARQHHDALLRELVLYRARHRGIEVDLIATDRARAVVVDAVMAALDASHRAGTARPAVPSGHPSPLPWVPGPLDIELRVPADIGPAFGAMQDALDAAERLARAGALLARPGLSEIIAVRDWACEQVVAQLAGVEPSAWPGAEEERFVTDAHADAVETFDLASVGQEMRGLVAADDANRIVAVSRPLAEATGWRPEELVGRRVVALIPPRLREAHVAGFTRHLTTGEAHVIGVPLRLPVLCADGSELLCSFLIEMAPPVQGRTIYLAWIEPLEDVAPPPPASEPVEVDYVNLFRSLPTPYMVMSPDLVIVEANDAYLRTVVRTREELVGRPVFECFPPTPDALDEHGVSRIQRSFEHARDTGRPDTMPLQKYDIPDPVNGGLVERFWSLISLPVLDDRGRTVLVAQRAEDVTDFVHERDGRYVDGRAPERLRRRTDEVEADLFTRAQELAEALRSKDETARRLAGLAASASRLTAARTADDLQRMVLSGGLAVLGADVGALLSADDDGAWRVWASGTRSEDLQVTAEVVPYDSPSALAWVARTGQRLLLPTREAGLAFDPRMDELLYERSGRLGWAFVPLRLRDSVIGSLAVGWSDEHQTTGSELEFLDALAAQLAQALARIRATDAQLAAAAQAQRLSETLQRSLLTQPPRSDDLDIAVRYQPAAHEAKVGGDWYDAFRTAAGSTVLVVGDVCGHDQTAAALMGQIRNLVRGMTFDSVQSPALLLSRLDAAMEGLSLDTLATAVLARVEPVDATPGTWLLRWSSAGHVPPVLRTPDGVVRTLADAEPELLLGVDAGAPRSERTVLLPPGSTLVLYTDGLVERRRAPLDMGMAHLMDVVSQADAVDADDLADMIVRLLGPASANDDLALLVLRTAEAAPIVA